MTSEQYLSEYHDKGVPHLLRKISIWRPFARFSTALVRGRFVLGYGWNMYWGCP